MKQKITKRVIDLLVPSERDVVIWDTEIRGFGIRCRANGSKHYVLKLRVGNRQRWVTIGRHGSPWTVEMARTRAFELLGQKAKGEDPAAARDQEKTATTMAQLADRFLKDHVAHQCKPTTASEYRRVVEKLIKPELGFHRITDVNRTDIVRLRDSLRDLPYQANRVLAVISKMMNLAEEWGLRPDNSNPCRHVSKFREIKRERYLSAEELQRLGAALANAENNGTESPFVLAAIRLLIFTGARLSEILHVRWDQVDVERGTFKLPDSKTGAKLIYLNAPAKAVLGSLPRMQDNPYVIAGHKRGTHLVNLQKPWRRIRSAAGLDDLRIHDLRHSFASVAAGAGMSLPIIGGMLGHSQPATTARYAHLATNPMQEAVERVGHDIAALMEQPVAREANTKAQRKRRPRSRL